MANPNTIGASRTGVAWIRQELVKMLKKYDKIRDCMLGSDDVKARRDLYLPRPNPADVSEANRLRYDAYILRTVFYNTTYRTVRGMVGQIFLRDPVINIPPGLDIVKTDADGEGIGLQLLMTTACEYSVAYGRAGLLVTYPNPAPAVSDAAADASRGIEWTQAELAEGDIRPVMRIFDSRKIINWRKAMRGARRVYTLVVIENLNWGEAGSDGFEMKSDTEFYVLRLLPAAAAKQEMVKMNATVGGYDYAAVMDDDVNSSTTDVFKFECWRRSAGRGQYAISEVYYPTDKTGKFLNEIPFYFIGADKNDDACGTPPVYDLAELNLAHYRNSADYQESCYVVGQPTVVVTGITEAWATNILKGGVALGSRGVIPLPVGGQAQLLQAADNSMPKESMDTIEKQMVALGAKLVEQREVARTATEAAIESTAESTILGTIAKNVGLAFENALKAACKFTGDDPTAISIKLNTEFDLTKMDPQERFELILEWLNDAITFSEMRSNLRRGGVATLDDDEAQAALLKQAADKQTLAVQNAKDMAAAMPAPVGPGGAGAGGTPKVPKPPKKPGGGKAASQSQ